VATSNTVAAEKRSKVVAVGIATMMTSPPRRAVDDG
jgi:hypothetical protein